MEPTLIFQSHPKGKLLLTGEYSVLDGALALAVPTHFGQSFVARLSHAHEPLIHWSSTDEKGNLWFQASFSQGNLQIISATDDSIALMLQQLLQTARHLRPLFLRSLYTIEVTSTLDFPRNWGLGTSSTLVAALAQWAGVSPYLLLEASFGGSGYDLACAYAGAPILFQKLPNSINTVKWTSFHPAFSPHLYFVHLGQKQNSREGIAQYKNRDFDKAALAQKITAITQEVRSAPTLSAFSASLQKHEQLIGDALDLQPIQQRLFSDFEGVVKSLGAWGGDFVLACSQQPTTLVKDYFKHRGFHTVLPYHQMVLYK